MDIRVSLDGAAGMLLLSLPWLLLAVAAWRAARVNGRRDDPRVRRVVYPTGSRDDDGKTGVPQEPLAPRIDRALGVMEMAPPSLTDAGLSNSAEGAGITAHDPVFVAEVEPAPALSLQDQEDALVSAVEAAKAERDDAALSRNSVMLARMLIARSARSEAAVLLQSAALVARRAKLPVVHAEARIELADLARGDGDLTAACEHWQMAKLMFHETGRRADQDRIAELMRQNRCPTDWILTNF